jgi:ribosome maturation protein SDO1
MVSLDEAVIARLESGGHKFEILIDPEAAQAFRESGEIDWDDALATEGVWSDSAKGEHAGDEAVQ